MTLSTSYDRWKRVPIKEVYLGLYDGPHATPKPASDGPVFLGIKNIRENGQLVLSEVRHIAEEDFTTWIRRVIPQPGDIVFTYEATLNLYAIIPEGFRGCLGRRLALIRPNPAKIDPCFLFYYFFSEDWRRTISKNILSGSTVDRIPLTSFPDFEISLPPLPNQHKIASILSAYDDLIENNTRRIQILEKMAQMIYQEWFVHFRFPGHEQVRMVGSEIGEIPDGWEVKGIGEIVETLGGGTPSTQKPEYWDGDVIWYSPTDLTTAGTMFISESAKRITELGLQKSSARLFPPYSVMMTSRATIGVTAINTKPSCTNQGFITCVPNKQVSGYQIYFWISENKEKIMTLASGATFKEINKTTFRKLPIVVSDTAANKRFVEMLTPLAKQIENLQAKNYNLLQTRDLLLPKLISGEIDIEDLDIDIRSEDHDAWK
jgi:type I restriction enzyme S subunit